VRERLAAADGARAHSDAHARRLEVSLLTTILKQTPKCISTTLLKSNEF
jgi:hypothetical protein